MFLTHLPVPFVSVAVSIVWTFLSKRFSNALVGNIAEKRAANLLSRGQSLAISESIHPYAWYRKSTWTLFFSTLLSLIVGNIVSYSVRGRTVADMRSTKLLKLNGFSTMELQPSEKSESYEFYFEDINKCVNLTSIDEYHRNETWSPIWFEVEKTRSAKGTVELKPTGRYDCKENDGNKVEIKTKGWDDNKLKVEDVFERKLISNKKYKHPKLCSTADPGLCYSITYVYVEEVEFPKESPRTKKAFLIENYNRSLELWVYPIDNDIMVRTVYQDNEGDYITMKGNWVRIAGSTSISMQSVITSLAVLSEKEISGDIYEDLRKAYLAGLSSRGNRGVIETSLFKFGPNKQGFVVDGITVGHHTEGYVSTSTILYAVAILAIISFVRSSILRFSNYFETGDISYEPLDIERGLYIASLSIANQLNGDGNIRHLNHRATVARTNGETVIQEGGNINPGMTLLP